MRMLLLFAVLLGVPIAGAAFMLKEEPGWIGGVWSAGTSDEASRYISAPVEEGHVRQVVTASGTLRAVATVEVSSQLSGQIAELHASFNEPVQKGQPLAQLDRASYEARLAEAKAAFTMTEAAVETHEARLERARIDFEDAKAQRAILQARLDNAQVRLDAAERALVRRRQLAERNTIAEAALDEVETERDSAAAALREAEAIAAAHRHAVEGARADLHRAEAELANARASLPMKEAQRRLADIDLDRTTIRSPIDGLVVGRSVEEGQIVAASLEAPTLFTIAGDLGSMEIHARIDEADIGKITVGQKAAFAVDAYPDRRFEAVVSEIRKAPQVLQNVVTYTVILETDNPDNLLLPGMTALVRIVTEELGPVLKVPLAALRYSPRDEKLRAAAETQGALDGRAQRIWLLGPAGRPVPRAVTVGPDDGSHAALLAGAVVQGDEVVVSEVADEEPRQFLGIRLGF